MVTNLGNKTHPAENEAPFLWNIELCYVTEHTVTIYYVITMSDH